jgi:hypothetical protein
LYLFFNFISLGRTPNINDTNNRDKATTPEERSEHEEERDEEDSQGKYFFR